jgi:hypothetical protein
MIERFVRFDDKLWKFLDVMQDVCDLILVAVAQKKE